MLLSDGRWHSNVQLNRICFRYGARIFDLKRDGYNIDSERVKGGLWQFRLDLKRQRELF